MSAASDGHMHIVQWLYATYNVDLTLQDQVMTLFLGVTITVSYVCSLCVHGREEMVVFSRLVDHKTSPYSSGS